MFRNLVNFFKPNMVSLEIYPSKAFIRSKAKFMDNHFRWIAYERGFKGGNLDSVSRNDLKETYRQRAVEALYEAHRCLHDSSEKLFILLGILINEGQMKKEEVSSLVKHFKEIYVENSEYVQENLADYGLKGSNRSMKLRELDELNLTKFDGLLGELKY